jgi:hypothetical protein
MNSKIESRKEYYPDGMGHGLTDRMDYQSFAKGGSISNQMHHDYYNIKHEDLPENIKSEFEVIKSETKNFTENIEDWKPNFDRLFEVTKKHYKEAFVDYVKPEPKKLTKANLETKLKGLKVLEKRLKGDNLNKILVK